MFPLRCGGELHPCGTSPAAVALVALALDLRRAAPSSKHAAGAAQQRSPASRASTIVSPRNGARQTSHAVVVKVDRRQLPPRAAPVRPRTRSSARATSASASTASPTASTRSNCSTRSTARSATAAWSAPPSTTRSYSGPNGVLAERIGAAGSYSPGDAAGDLLPRPAARLLPPGRQPGPEQRRHHALPRRHQLPDPAPPGPRPRTRARSGKVPSAKAAAAFELQARPAAEAQYFTLYSQV